MEQLNDDERWLVYVASYLSVLRDSGGRAGYRSRENNLFFC